MTIFRYPLLIISLLIQLNAFHRVMLFLVELCEHLDAVLMVGMLPVSRQLCMARMALPMSTPRSGIDEARMLPRCAATCHIAVVDKALARHTCLLAQAGEDGCRSSIASILLGSIELDDRSAAQHRMVGRVVFLGIVGMPCVGVVCRNHEGTLHSLIVSLLGATLSQGDALEHVGEERDCRLPAWSASPSPRCRRWQAPVWCRWVVKPTAPQVRQST